MKPQRPRRFLPIFAVLAALQVAVVLPPPALADEPLIFDVYTELDFNDYLDQERHSAFALGENYLGWFSSDHETTFDATASALRDCNLRIDKELHKTDSKTCELVGIDGKYVWKVVRPPELGSGALQLPDEPLNKSQIVGDIATANAIVLSLHGCDVPLKPAPEWVLSWYRFFKARNIAVIQPDSFADPHPEVCPGKGTDLEADQVLRLRVDQTIRTLGILERKYLGKPIYIWGHSQGARVAQLFNFGVDGVILSGDNCSRDAINKFTPVLLVLGDEDQYVKFSDETGIITPEMVKKHCPKYEENENRKFVIVKQMDHFTGIWHQNVMDAVSSFLNVKSYNSGFEIWSGALPESVTAEVNTYRTAPLHSALAIGPGERPAGFVVTGWDYKSDAEYFALENCERGQDYVAYVPGTQRRCKIALSK